MLSRLWVGALSGLAGSLAVAASLLLKSAAGFMPDLGLIAILGRGLGVSSLWAWGVHFVTGALWGALFVYIHSWIPAASIVTRGMLLSLVPYAGTMLILMPAAQAGWFGIELGVMTPIATLVLHLVFGAVLGVAFREIRLDGQRAR